ncbi:hypothetical protein P280DRAFT_524154 [Massarina eburnea CBS 473.64]|uniref:GPI anchored cell wall protein n=1 Tax=Massarina eburnea CBS 473.64 TaxID=1395130 RepID=A0A6A6RGC5_9PLEO|nr:hypothetical protein P280DRAFT_524154 [Massarina eburnea CBS 473.64]
MRSFISIFTFAATALAVTEIPIPWPEISSIPNPGASIVSVNGVTTIVVLNCATSTSSSSDRPSTTPSNQRRQGASTPNASSASSTPSPLSSTSYTKTLTDLPTITDPLYCAFSSDTATLISSSILQFTTVDGIGIGIPYTLGCTSASSALTCSVEGLDFMSNATTKETWTVTQGEFTAAKATVTAGEEKLKTSAATNSAIVKGAAAKVVSGLGSVVVDLGVAALLVL